MKFILTSLFLFSQLQGIQPQKTDFRCPEEFGYYPHQSDCSLYYVCVFGGPLLESCTGGLVYSEDLQTCDWPRNVPCNINKIDIDGLLVEEEENVNIAIESKKNTQTNNREPRKQTTNENKFNTIIKEDTDGELEKRQQAEVEAEILRNIDEDILDSLSPQPSIVSAITHGLRNRNRIHNNQKGKDVHSTTPRKSQSAEQTISAQNTDFGERSKTSTENSEPEIDYSEYIDSDDYHTDTSDIEQALLAGYPGVSRHLDDSQDHLGSDIFYYTEWDDPIYDQFQDYIDVDEISDDYSDGVKESSRSSEAENSNKHLRDSSKDIFLDLSNYPVRLPRNTTAGPQPGESATRCDPEQCQLPDCRCGGPSIPIANTTTDKIPQLVMLTFDDSINDLNQRLYESIFHPIRRNPNGCPISSTFYVSHEWTDYGHVQNMYSDGHEIASHSISHSFGEQFSMKKWLKEMAGQREILAAYGGVNLEDIRGMRAPFLAIGGNNMFSMLYDANFTYDSSMPIYENRPPSFPYTLDYKIFHDCMIPPCPNKAFPGLWEIPLVMWNDHKDGRCSMADACSNPPDAEGVYLMIMKNFQRHYQTNRAPFGLFYHPAWFTTPHHKEGFELFLDTVTAMEDVWLVSSWQTIQWMRDPTPLSNIMDFKPFQCNYKNRPPQCDNPKVCNLWHKSGVRYMRTCQQCPSIYPWTGRTGIANSLVDDL